MDVIRDVLDKPISDRNGREMGRVDGIVLERSEGGPPRLTAVLIGPSVLGLRLHPALGRWIAAVEQGFGVAAGRPVRIDFNDIDEIGSHIRTNLAIGETAAATVEQRVRAWLNRIPGAR
jgi:sporulation protein YlmC with PRC-barrel domain